MGDDWRVVHTTPCSCGPDGEPLDPPVVILNGDQLDGIVSVEINYERDVEAAHQMFRGMARAGRITAEAEMIIPCCRLDYNGDGDCPRHPRGRYK